jgi:hypothetical protein
LRPAVTGFGASSDNKPSEAPTHHIHSPDHTPSSLDIVTPIVYHIKLLASSMVPTEQEDGDMALTGEHMRAARALLNWSQVKLARASGVSLPTIKRLEVMSGTISANTMTVEAIRKAIVDAGVDLIEEDGGGAGARLRQRHQP